VRTDFGYFEEEDLGKPYDVRLLRRLSPYSRPYRKLLVASISLVILITLLNLALPYVTKIVIDRYIVPVQKADGNRQGDRKGGGVRYYRIRMNETGVGEIVAKYPEFFKVKDGVAQIPFQQLSRLDHPDIICLRSKDLAGIAGVAAIFLLLIVADFILNFVQVMIMEYTGQYMMHDLRVTLFRHIQSLSVSFFAKNPIGRLVTRVTNDVQNMHELFTSIISFVFKDLFLLIGIAAVMVSISWRLALVSFAVLPIVVYASFKFSGRARKIFRLLRIKVAEINTTLSETISGMRVIQIFRQESENYRRFKRLNHENYLAGMSQIRIFGTFMPFIEFMGVMALAIVIFYGGWGVLGDSISLGAMVAFISYMRMFFRPIRDIAEKYNILQNAMASAERIFLVLDNTNRLHRRYADDDSKRDDGTGRIDRITEVAMDNVHFEYVTGEPVLKAVSFELQAGKTLAVVGPTGSGKTTLINLLVRFYDPTTGKVRINGQDIRTLDTSAFRAKMALVMQEPFLFSGSIRDNIVQGNGTISDQAMADILKASNCKRLIDGQPDGLDTQLSEGGTTISSGERQLISIARAMARNPDLIILDEATSYIDSTTEQQIQEALDNLLSDQTSIVIAHRLSTARNADRIIVLNRGRIIESGTHAELMDSRGFYFRLTQL
jgi:ATP-binding cassette, subfamily B, multidrug efflux pump